VQVSGAPGNWRRRLHLADLVAILTIAILGIAASQIWWVHFCDVSQRAYSSGELTKAPACATCGDRPEVCEPLKSATVWDPRVRKSVRIAIENQLAERDPRAMVAGQLRRIVKEALQRQAKRP
jgi:hypothetical protein